MRKVSYSMSVSLDGARRGAVSVPYRADAGAELKAFEDPLFPYRHAVALAEEIPGAELLAPEQTGDEYFPRATWDLVVPAILRHTGPTRG